MAKIPKSVVIIDDSIDDIEACSRQLSNSSRYDYTIYTDIDPLQGLTKLSDVDCAIIDYQFPNITGLQLIERIKRNHPSLPIVVLTARSDENLAVTLLKAGASDYMSKAQMGENLLEEKIAQAISKQSSALEDNTINVLVIDDNQDDLELCERLLAKCDGRYTVHANTHSDYLIEQLADGNIHCLLVDYFMPGKSGLDILREVNDLSPHVAVIVMSGQGNEKIAVDAIKNGAENYLVKGNLTSQALHSSISQAVDKKRLQKHLRSKELELIEHKKKLKDSHQFLDLILESMPNYVFVKDKNYHHIKANKAFLELYPEESRDKVIGYSALEAFDAQEVEDFLANDSIAFEQGFSKALECIGFPNGERKWLSTTKTRFYNSKQDVFILGVATDVTERETLIKQLEKSNADLEDFAYVASHDLKSPLNAISKLMHWINNDYADSLPDEAKRLFTMIQERVATMSTLLDDLLQYSRVQRTISNDDLIDAHELEAEILSLTDNRCALNLRFEGDTAQLPKMALKMVLLNLINNAVKHNDKSEVEVRVNITDKAKAYHIRVSDNGPGIPHKYSDKIFQMFQRLNLKQNVEGSGMGLAMVKKVLDYYTGKIELEPCTGRGATFMITWPKNTVYEYINAK